MLKQFIALLLDKFIKSKKVYISERSVQLSTMVSATILGASNTWHEVISPVDGWFCAVGSGITASGIDVQMFVTSGEYLSSTFSGYIDNFSTCSLPCKKGARIRIAIYHSTKVSECGYINFYSY